MKLKDFLKEDNAVSPVIGVILMVAITVILAAVIGTFVLGLGENVQQTSPQASFQFNWDSNGVDKLTVSHAGGDTVGSTEIYLKASSDFSNSSNSVWGPKPDDDISSNTSSITWNRVTGVMSGSDIAAGSSVSVYADSTNGWSDDTMRVVWQSQNGDSSANLGEWSGPDA